MSLLKSWEQTVIENIHRDVTSGQDIKSETGHNTDQGSYLMGYNTACYEIESEAGVCKSGILTSLWLSWPAVTYFTKIDTTANMHEEQTASLIACSF